MTTFFNIILQLFNKLNTLLLFKKLNTVQLSNTACLGLDLRIEIVKGIHQPLDVGLVHLLKMKRARGFFCNFELSDEFRT